MNLSENFLNHFESIITSDERKENHSRFCHKLTDMLTIVILGSICGADNWVEISQFGSSKKEWLKGFLELPGGIPSHDTFGRIFAALDSKKFEKCFVQWAESLSGIIPKTNCKEIISIDGKTSRRSHNKKKGKNPLHMVSAWASEQNLLLGQLSTEEKSNEIEAIPRLLDMIDVEGAIVTLDAMGCQKAIASRIIDKKADYILNLKDNQPTLASSVKSIFNLGQESRFKGMHYLQKIKKVKDHGRIERRRYTLISCKNQWSFGAMWPGMKSIGMVEVKRTVDNQTTHSTRYFLTSLTYKQIDDFMRGVRKHWNIEINLHWSLDVSFADDINRSRNGNSAENLSIIKRIALNLLKQDKSVKAGISAKRKKAGWDHSYLFNVLALM